MLARIAVLALVLVGCAPGNPSPSPVPPTTVPTVTPTAASTIAAPTPSPAATVPEGFVRVRFLLRLTGGGVSSAAFGLDVGVVDGATFEPVVLCAYTGEPEACREGGSFDAFYDLPLGATVSYSFYQILDTDGDPRHVIEEDQFTVDEQTVERDVTYDIQA